jgi:hypothetical protein
MSRPDLFGRFERCPGLSGHADPEIRQRRYPPSGKVARPPDHKRMNLPVEGSDPPPVLS